MSDAPDDDVRSIHRFVRRLIGQLLAALRCSAAFGVGIAYLRAGWWKKGPLSGLYGSEEIAWRPADTAWEQHVAAERLQIAQEDETHRLAALFRATRDLDSYALERIVAQRLSTDLSGQGRSWFCSRGTEKGTYHAVAIVQFNDEELRSLPTISLRDARNENETVVNLFSTAVSSALDWFVTEMPTRQSFYSGPTRPEIDSILRTAGSRLMSSIRDSVSPTLISRDLFVALDNLSIRRHESAAGSGKVAFVRADSIAALRPLQFRAAVPLDETDWARKLLELAHGSMALLSPGEEAVGIADLGAIGSSHPTVTFEGQHQWSLRAGPRALMHVSSGVPCLPAEPLSKDAFARTFVRVFPRHAGSLDNLWATIEAVLSQHHGAIVIIAEDAATGSCPA